jgi:hypothetical protein
VAEPSSAHLAELTNEQQDQFKAALDDFASRG